jgi:putative ABC transport system permease protein
MVTSVFERTREIGVLRAIGWRKKRVVALVLGESLGLSVAGAIVGTIVGTMLLRALAASPSSAGLIEGHLDPSIIVKVLLMAIATGVLGAVYPAWWAARMCPTESLRHT